MCVYVPADAESLSNDTINSTLTAPHARFVRRLVTSVYGSISPIHVCAHILSRKNVCGRALSQIHRWDPEWSNHLCRWWLFFVVVLLLQRLPLVTRLLAPCVRPCLLHSLSLLFCVLRREWNFCGWHWSCWTSNWTKIVGVDRSKPQIPQPKTTRKQVPKKKVSLSQVLAMNHNETLMPAPSNSRKSPENAPKFLCENTHTRRTSDVAHTPSSLSQNLGQTAQQSSLASTFNGVPLCVLSGRIELCGCGSCTIVEANELRLWAKTCLYSH